MISFVTATVNRYISQLERNDVLLRNEQQYMPSNKPRLPPNISTPANALGGIRYSNTSIHRWIIGEEATGKTRCHGLDSRLRAG